MCEVCAVFGVGQHWTDAADPMGLRNVAAGILENRAERAKRLQLINRILRPVGLVVSDWDGEAFSVEDTQGRRQIAPDLSALWRIAEQLGQIHIDPLEADSCLPLRHGQTRTAPRTECRDRLPRQREDDTAETLSAAAAWGSTLVIINEFGRESIDDRITLHLKSEIETIADGCLCCTVLGQLQQTLLHILTRRARGELPELQRIIVETSGLADPAPILGTILSDENLHEYIEVGPCVTTFDALEGLLTLEEFAEAAPQLAAADRVIVTKTDLADSAGIGTLMTAIRDVNPACDITLNDVPEAIFAPVKSGIIDSPLRAANTPVHLHTGSVRSFSTVLDRSIDWATFSVWLTALLNRHGDHILRFKSVMAVRSSGKLVVQGVRHRVYPPSHLPAEDNEDNVSRLVFIVNGISEQRILDSLKRFTAATSPFSGLPGAVL